MSSQVVEAKYSAEIPTPRYKLLGIVGFAVAIFIRQLTDYPRRRPIIPLQLVFAALRRLRKNRTEPSVAQAQKLLLSIHWAGEHYLGRVACFEVSLGACIAGALIGHVPAWCMGVKFDPVVHHSWIEVNGQPVGEHESDAWPYQAFERA